MPGILEHLIFNVVLKLNIYYFGQWNLILLIDNTVLMDSMLQCEVNRTLVGSYSSMKMEQRVPKRWHLNYRCR
jgi:hypothetical protein